MKWMAMQIDWKFGKFKLYYQAMKMELFTEEYSWLILSEGIKIIEAVFHSGNPDAVVDVVLLEKWVCNILGIIIPAHVP